jgi:hypothetical protein
MERAGILAAIVAGLLFVGAAHLIAQAQKPKPLVCYDKQGYELTDWDWKMEQLGECHRRG